MPAGDTTCVNPAQSFTEDLTTRAGVTNYKGQVSDAYAILFHEYSSPKRFYHTISHAQTVAGLVKSWQPTNVAGILAGWYHDAVYNPERADDEDSSAMFAWSSLSRLGFDTATVATVAAYLLARVPAGEPKQLLGES